MTRPSPLRGAPGLLVTFLLPALVACGAASRNGVRSCQGASDCGSAALCVDGACVASTLPSAAFTPPTGVTTNRLVSVTATAQDGDPGDAVVAWAWTVTPVSATCPADLDVSDGPTLQAVFWCAGTYELALVVQDTAGGTSEPVRHRVDVTALAGAPTVTAGAPQAVEHRCAGTPLRCELAQPVALVADGQAPLGGPVTYSWTAVPPDASRAGTTVHLSPGATSRTPGLALETGGAAISGTWQFRVRISDGAGNLAQAAQLVSVGNREPVIDAVAFSMDHRFEGGAYRADGLLSVPVRDPDGDPLELSLSLVEPGGSGCTAALSAVSGASGQLTLACPGPAGLMSAGRALQVSATDANGAAASSQLAVQVRNRLPLIRPAVAGVTELELHHSVGACPSGVGQCFLVTGDSPFTVDDPDGDPVSNVTLVPGVEAGRTASFGEAGTGPAGPAFRFGTPVASPAEFRAADGTSGFTISATASDPFGASLPAEPMAIRILNRAPVLKVASAAVSTGHRYDAVTAQYLASAQLAVFEDPDGDPLVDAGSVGDESCGAFSFSAGVASVACSRPFAVGSASYPTLSGFAGAHALAAVAGDGWAVASSAATLTVTSTPPSVPSYTGAVEACTCECRTWEPEPPRTCMVGPFWVADRSKAAFQVRPLDADGDPLAVSFTSTATVTPAALTALPEACAVSVAATTFPVSVQVTVNDGVSQASGTWTATQVTCAKAGQLCVLP